MVTQSTETAYAHPLNWLAAAGSAVKNFIETNPVIQAIGRACTFVAQKISSLWQQLVPLLRENGAYTPLAFIGGATISFIGAATAAFIGSQRSVGIAKKILCIAVTLALGAIGGLLLGRTGIISLPEAVK